MAYDLEEQEQIDELKAWWNKNGNLVSWLLLVAVAAIAGLQGWKYYQNQQSLQASSKFETLRELSPKDSKAIQALTGELMDKYASTPYAARAAIAAARSNLDAKDSKSAKAQLEWAVKNAKEEAVKAVAMLQLAGLQYEEKEYDAALKTLEQAHDAGFDGLFADLKGDVLVAQNKLKEAKAAYTEALAKLDVQGRYFQYTQHKLEALGS